MTILRLALRNLTRRRVRRALIALAFFLWLVAVLAPSGAGAAFPRIHVLHVDGAIVPVTAGYLVDGIEEAEFAGADAVVIVLNTPGGLLSSTEDIVNKILDAKVPVVVYVYRWAGSAGTFITVAAHVAAMSPGSRIGAASPVSIGTEGAESEVMKKKITEDTAAWIRAIAEQRGRNVEAAEAAVVEATSYTDNEALELGLIDLRADNLAELMVKLEGKQVTLGDGRVVELKTEGYTIIDVEMSAIERFLEAISNPNIAYILLSVAMAGIFLELANPGSILPGVVGVLSLLLAFYSLAMLQAHYVGIILIVLAFVMFVTEVFIASHGMLTVGGITSLTIGSLILFSRGAPAFRLHINPWVVGIVVGGVTAFFVFAVAAVVRAHRRPATTGREGLVGQVAVAQTPLDPKGTVMAEGERWVATAEGERVEPGEEVVITKVEGLKLWVSKRK